MCPESQDVELTLGLKPGSHIPKTAVPFIRDISSLVRRSAREE